MKQGPHFKTNFKGVDLYLEVASNFPVIFQWKYYFWTYFKNNKPEFGTEFLFDLKFKHERFKV